MSKKRKKRRRSPRSPAPEPEAATDVEEREEPDPPAADEGRRAWSRGAPSPFPPFGASMARGLRAAGSEPTVLVAAFLFLFATWAAFAAIGAPLHPQQLVGTMSLPPMHLFIADLPVALGAVTSPVRGLVVVAGVFLLRGISFALLIALLTQALRDDRSDLRAAFAALPRAAIRLTALLFLEAAALVFANQLLAGFLGDMSILLLGVGLYFLVFVPVVTVVEDVAPREALRRGFRAARLPGTRHVSMVLGYFFLTIYAVLVSPFDRFAPATPSVFVWAYALVTTFLHVAVLGAFVYRWLDVRHEVPEGPAGRPR